ncbi:sulfite exporter TauE/SafE family protein [Pseudomarimonas salicorniae]|uniref:Probable membrane transporter protein n=1 Tax=Pseudomarimonas salicorniae TaxID=2933270 RepID=A0ABT0GFI1_9GAMM|nr:sulfite exporter TauE/SafE family protein [Lysobacter sp. CAU 1642]MCK7593304.1 sulfite exporter TauE/SafE family protein [Lysobacter sp. CAU 1642]
MPTDRHAPLRRLLPWLLWLLLFYAVWGVLVDRAGGLALLAEHWGIALAMGLGSYVAGSTPMGGGTVGFPILVLLFDQPAELGRDFSFAVQSIGMVSASILILCRRQPLEWAMLGPAMLGSLIGTPLGILFVAPLVPALWIKLLFAVIWASFGVLHLLRTREFCSVHGPSAPMPRFDAAVGFGVGLGAGLCVASVTGVGIDMILYAALILLRRADLRIAIPTSVLIMAFTSVVGILFKSQVTGVQPGVYENWLAAAPIVAVGAPLGVFIVNRIGRQPTLYFVAVLCVAQFAWTLWREWALIGVPGLLAAIASVLVFNLAFEWMHRWGEGHAGNRRTEAALNTYSMPAAGAAHSSGPNAG